MSKGRPILIVGAGPTGLGAAAWLEKHGVENWLLVEREGVPGGLSKSFVDDHGYTWDIGGHVVFSHYSEFDAALEGLLGDNGWLFHERESWIRILSAWVPYPFQYNIHRLPPAESAECLDGLVQAAGQAIDRAPGDFGEFIDRTFGQGIARLFMRPYNWKVWAHEPESMSSSWVGERVAAPDLRRVTRNLGLMQDDVSWGPNNRFAFPRSGGTGAIWSALSGGLSCERVRLGTGVVGLDVEEKRAILSDGTQFEYAHLISTMPLDQLAVMSGVKGWVEATSKLSHSSVHVVGIGVDGRPPDSLASKCWMYFPEPSPPAYRVTHFSHYSPENVPDADARWSLMAEVSESVHKPIDPNETAAEVVEGLVREGLISSKECVSHVWTYRTEYGYPTPTLDRDSVLRSVLPALKAHGILSRGRFGGWRYEVGNMDHSFMQGWEAARMLVTGEPEVTLWHPEVVNA